LDVFDNNIIGGAYMVKVKVGKKVPDFKATLTKGFEFVLSENLGKNIIVYFYPKDNTPGCTKESESFRDYFQSFRSNNAEIIGVSRDSVLSHEKFIKKYAFPFDLISDEDEKVCQLFDVIKEKNMYGKKYMGIERSTFIINVNGNLVHEWRKVKVKGHVEEVLKTLEQM
jgi:peroxiredoxin Q/BCP